MGSGKLNGIRAAKYVFRVVSLVVSLLILLIVAGPIAGAASPGLVQHPLGIGVDLQSVQSQLSFLDSGSTIVGTHGIIVPAFNNWPLPGSASLILTLIVNGQTIYQTEPAKVQLAPFQSGQLDISMDVSNALAGQLQGENVGIGGTMSLSENQFWTVTVTFPQQ